MRRVSAVPILRSAKGQASLAALFYFAFAVYLTWPLLLHLNSRIFGVQPGDPMGSIAIFRELVDERMNPFAPGTFTDFNAPHGVPIDWSLNVASFPSTALLYLLALAFGPVAAWGLFALMGFVASALSMFLLVRRYTDEPWVAFVLGWAFGFYPFAVLTAHSVHFVHGWVFVLLGWRMVELAARPTPRNGLFAGAAAVLAMSWTPYFILFAGVCYATFVAVDLLNALLRGGLRAHARAHAVSGVLVLPFVAALAVLWTAARPVNVVAEAGAASLNKYAARPIEYVLPPAEHPLLGSWSGPIIERSVEPLGAVYPLYLGVSLLALAVVAAFVGLRRGSIVPITFAVVALVGLVLSLTPQVEVAGHLIRLPSSLVGELVGTWRIYARFVIVVMFAVCVLAGLGATFLLEGRTRAVRTALSAGIAVVVPIDLWATPPVRTTAIVDPPVYRVLEEQPPGLVAEYPMRAADQAGDYSYLFHQHLHDKPIVNGFPRRSAAEGRALQLSRLDEPSTPNGLASLGVKYVVLQHEVERGAMPPGKPSQGFRLITDSPFAALYRVDARPGAATVPLSGFGLPEGNPPAISRWMIEKNAKFEVTAPCKACVGTLQFRTASFARPRTLTVRDGNGNVVARERVEGEPKSIRVPLRFSRRTIVTLRVDPPPDRINKYIGGTDTRTVAVSIIQPVTFVPDAGHRR